MPKVSVAISGGGHRAGLFGLGALLYLADAGVNRHVTSIASVSGGSMTNGYVAQEMDYREVSGPEFEAAVRPLAWRLAQGGTLFAAPATRIYVAVLAVTFLATLGVWWLPVGCAARLVLFVAALVVWASAVAGARGRVCARAFREVLYSPSGRTTGLEDINTNLDHVLCATDLQAGEHVYFSGRFVCSYRLGWGHPGGMALADAVQASACLPGAFPPRLLPTGRHRFTGGAMDSPPAWMVLSDGGVYDNMADQWAQGMADRQARWPAHAAEMRDAEILVVVNASAGLGFQAMTPHRLPVVGELVSLLRIKDILYDLTTSQRRAGLVGRFDRAALTGADLTGTLVHITQSPYRAARAFATADQTWPERALRARRVLEALGGDHEAEWAAVAARTPRAPTTLSAIGVARAAELLWHGYVLAMANSHVILDFPLLDIPSLDRFRALVAHHDRPAVPAAP